MAASALPIKQKPRRIKAEGRPIIPIFFRRFAHRGVAGLGLIPTWIQKVIRDPMRSHLPWRLTSSPLAYAFLASSILLTGPGSAAGQNVAPNVTMGAQIDLPAGQYLRFL